jgi:Protein of unknown function (DUF1549)/Protein of unknown function (DUF1553)/Planctomycete cytochrome C
VKARFLIISLSIIGVFWTAKSLYEGNQTNKVDYSTQVKPILNKHCITCHGGVKKIGGFSLLFRTDALAKTKSGKPAIIPFHPEQSDFIARLSHKDLDERMPYKANPLKKEEIDLLTRWVKEGAEWGDHWAYLSPKKVSVPNPEGFFASFSPFGNSWAKNDIDRFILQNLKKEGLKPTDEAPKATLIRRVYLDLIGLPPTPEQLAKFLADDSKESYEKVVDELLKSPQFGEKWASMWLDLARYSDSKGYQKDNARTIWEYRDWVIRAFNTNMPFDQFAKEQLAGDLLPNPTDDQLIATAFHRNTMNNDETGTVDEEFRVAAVLDRTNTTWDVFQGTTFSCVQCHSHPYDPFRHEEYYKFMAFFNNSRDEDTDDESPNLRRFSPEDKPKLEALNTWIKTLKPEEKAFDWLHFAKYIEPKFNAHDADNFVESALLGGRSIGLRNGGSCRLPNIKMDGMTQFVMNYSVKNLGGILEIHDSSPTGKLLTIISLKDTTEKGSAEIKSIKIPLLTGRHDLYLVGKNPNLKQTSKDVIKINWFTFMPNFPKSILTPSPSPNERGDTRTNTPLSTGEGLGVRFFNEKTFWDLVKAKTENTPIMQPSQPDYQRKTHVFTRGNWLVHGQEVNPDVPKSLHPFPKNAPRNRLGLAAWITDKKNPLTARTVVNRFWEQIFGVGIVETLEDFGTQGFKPVHPELLDYLSVKLMNEWEWKPKSILKEIVMSATYCQSSIGSRKLFEKDPSNHFLARGPRVRLSAEQVRDQTLAVSGLLSKKMYGKPVMPYQPDGVWAAVNSNLNYKQSEGEDQYRRAIYTFARRTGPYPSMFNFDSPSREVCVARRIRTNTPLQSLVLLNDPVFVEASNYLAKKAFNKTQVSENQIIMCYQSALQHEPNRKDLKALMNLYELSLENFKKNPKEIKVYLKDNQKPELAALSVVANAIINLDEFVTKQ